MSTIQIHNLQQGSPEWRAHRAKYHNASDAPAMLGISPYKTRSDLLRERATGITPEVTPQQQRIFDRGHQLEALARPIAEEIVGEELFPVVGSKGKLAASFDGITMMGDTVWEHKTLNQSLRYDWDSGNGWHLPEHYQAQMEHQLIVSGAKRVLFMASEQGEDGELHYKRCWYASDPAMHQRVIDGWAQFEKDLADYAPEPVQAEPVAAPVEGFGALTLRVEGRVLASNLDAFKAGAEAFIARLPKPADLQTDQDFANAEAAVKACSEAETRIKAAKEAALAQMADVDTVLRTADHIAETIRQARLALDKAVKAEKENRKAEIVRQASEQLQQHIDGINATLGEYAISYPSDAQGRLALAIKGRKSIASIADAAATELAALKIQCSQNAEKRRSGMAMIAAIAPEHAGLFADRVHLADAYSGNELTSVIAARIAEHQQREAARLEAERERIRQEEIARIERQQQVEKATTETPTAAPAHAPAMTENTPPGQFIKLGQINEAIAPFAITAQGLAAIGFHPAAHERAAKLYRASDWQAMQTAFIRAMQAAKIGSAQ